MYAASLSEGSSHMNQMETMEPLKKALMEAIAKQKLREDETLGRRIMGEEYEAFSRQSEKEVVWCPPFRPVRGNPNTSFEIYACDAQDSTLPLYGRKPTKPITPSLASRNSAERSVSLYILSALIRRRNGQSLRTWRLLMMATAMTKISEHGFESLVFISTINAPSRIL